MGRFTYSSPRLSITFLFAILISTFPDSQEQEASSSDFTYTYDTAFFKVPLDHFSVLQESTFQIRYLYNDTFWDREGNGPILFYTGNEGSVESFANNTGFMWELAKTIGGMLVFAEHRFYGQSIPEDFSFDELSSDTMNVIRYLTVEQVLADYAKLIINLKKLSSAESSPVIAFGGSYGGQLTAYLRMKYPHVVIGGIAASAPLFMDDSMCELHDKVLTSVFNRHSERCTKTIRKSWNAINMITKTDQGKEWLTSMWNLCSPLESQDNVTTLKSWLDTMYSDMGMVNYPYPANFIRDLPANPVKTFCEKIEVGSELSSLPLKHSTKERLLLARFYQGINMYYNHSGKVSCFDWTDVDDTGDGFNMMDAQSFSFQSCTELLVPICDDGVQDFFEPDKWDLKTYTEGCVEEFGSQVKPEPDRMEFFFGGRNIFAASNIVFSNGLLDPWYAYGVLQNVSDTLLAIIIPDSAHHMDLRASEPGDPPSVVFAREFEKQQILKWIDEFHQNERKMKELFSNTI